MKKDEYIAHRTEDGHTQTVKAHLEGTAALAEQFASAFGAAEWGRWAGLAHDIGKYSQPFQRRIRDPDHAPRTDHSTAGAQEAFRQRLLPISFAVAGHHDGLPDFGSRQDTADNSTLAGRLRRQAPDCSAWRQEVTLPQVSPLPFLDRNGFTDSFFTRMLYSCLVDADFLDTETFMQAGSAAEVSLDGGHQLRGDYMSLSVLLDRLTAKTDRWLATDTGSTLNRSRNDILRACIEHGEQWPCGLYTLTVPTGGGKTTASLAFALRHALAQGLERVIYVIPYTSIIDQTVEVFQEILGPENVLAHYGEAAFRQKDPEDLSPEEYRQLLAAENWDAPLVVTTAVQFFESLYANRSSRCRKLHNLARSVVILDEAQTLPLPYLRPCCAAIAQLVEHYGVYRSAVYCHPTGFGAAVRRIGAQPAVKGDLPRRGNPLFGPAALSCGGFGQSQHGDVGPSSASAQTGAVCRQPPQDHPTALRHSAQRWRQLLPDYIAVCSGPPGQADRNSSAAQIRASLSGGVHFTD